jgi:hypothetical protein
MAFILALSSPLHNTFDHFTKFMGVAHGAEGGAIKDENLIPPLNLKGEV